GQEGAAEQRADHRGDAAEGGDEEHEETLDRHEVVGGDVVVETPVQGPTEAGDGGRGGEDDGLGRDLVQADRGARDRAVVQRGEAAAVGAATDGEDDDGGDRERDREQDQLRLLAAEVDPEQLQAFDLQDATLVEQPGLGQGPAAHQCEGEGGQGQVEVVQPEGG